MKAVTNPVLALFALALCASVLAGCQTIASPFVGMAPDYTGLPEETMREVALEIERAIEAGEREVNITDRTDLVLGERVRQAIRTRATRIPLIDELRNTGFAWEQRNSLIAIMRSGAYKDATTSRERDNNANVVMGENDDRWALYEGLIDDNDYPAGSRGAIQQLFFEARIQVLEEGQLYEGPDGEPIAK